MNANELNETYFTLLAEGLAFSVIRIDFMIPMIPLTHYEIYHYTLIYAIIFSPTEWFGTKSHCTYLFWTANQLRRTCSYCISCFSSSINIYVALV